jgi:hypothetical protein
MMPYTMPVISSPLTVSVPDPCAASRMIEFPLTVPSKLVGSALVGPLTVMGPLTFAPSCFRSIETCPLPMVGFRKDHVPAHFPVTLTLGGAAGVLALAQPPIATISPASTSLCT